MRLCGGPAARLGLHALQEEPTLGALPRMAAHALAASVFFFCFQYFLMGQSIDDSAIWGGAGGAAAALLAWMQQRRGG